MTILIVDDDPDVADLIQEVLVAQGVLSKFSAGRLLQQGGIR